MGSGDRAGFSRDENLLSTLVVHRHNLFFLSGDEIRMTSFVLVRRLEGRRFQWKSWVLGVESISVGTGSVMYVRIWFMAEGPGSW